MSQLTRDLTYVGGRNNADIAQGGNLNYANLTQKEFTGGFLDPDLSHNTANATQFGNNGTYILSQGSKAYVPTNVQSLTQSGFNNYGDIDQLGYTNLSYINQSGNNNYATLDQDNPIYGPGFFSWDKSYSWQSANNNSLFINQTGTFGYKLADSRQNGAWGPNTTTINQIGVGPEEVIGEQSGNNDILHVYQTY